QPRARHLRLVPPLLPVPAAPRAARHRDRSRRPPARGGRPRRGCCRGDQRCGPPGPRRGLRARTPCRLHEALALRCRAVAQRLDARHRSRPRFRPPRPANGLAARGVPLLPHRDCLRWLPADAARDDRQAGPPPAMTTPLWSVQDEFVDAAVQALGANGGTEVLDGLGWWNLL